MRLTKMKKSGFILFSFLHFLQVGTSWRGSISVWTGPGSLWSESTTWWTKKTSSWRLFSGAEATWERRRSSVSLPRVPSLLPVWFDATQVLEQIIYSASGCAKKNHHQINQAFNSLHLCTRSLTEVRKLVCLYVRIFYKPIFCWK